MPSKKMFYDYFKESMDSLGLPVPQSLFGNLLLARATIKEILGVVEKWGTRVTLRELLLTIPAGTEAYVVVSELAQVVGGAAAAFYVGACLGALAYATGNYTADRLWASNQDFGDLVNKATAQGIKIPDEMQLYLLQQRTRTAVA